MTSLSDFSAKAIDGTERPLAEYEGKTVLVVNTASKCGFTPQYAGLEELYEEYRDQGLVILGFPCDQFGHQEPGNEEQIEEFCSVNYGVSFPMFSKIEVNGKNTHPLYEWLKSQKGGLAGSRIKWNFTKFLVGKDGQPVKRYGSATTPKAIADDIKQELNK